MATENIKDWSDTAATNTDVNGVSIAEGCPPSNVNDAMREIMASVKYSAANLDLTNLIIPATIVGTTATDSATLGSELLTSSNWTATDWTGDFATGFDHNTGNTTALTNTLAAVVNNLYQVAVTVTGLTAGSFTITFGGVISNRTFSDTGTWGVKAGTTGALSFTPTTDFDGTIVISIKQITGTYNPILKLLDSTGAATFEIRSSLASLNNTFLGIASGRYNTTGYSNTAQGTNVLYSNTTGYNNTAQGTNAIYSNTTGNYNSAQGTNALYSNTTGNYNSAQGYNALYSNTTGTNNTAQGRQAGRYQADGTTALTDPEYSTYIGTNTRGYNNSDSYTNVFGSGAIGIGANTTVIGATTNTVTSLNGKVGINTTAPTGMLHLPAGTATANTAPLKFTSGTNLTTPEAGAIEFDGTNFYMTPATVRYIMSALDRVQAYTKQQSGTQYTLTSTSNHIATDCNNGNNFVHTMTENTTLDNPTNIVAGTYYTWTFIQITAEKILALGSYFKTTDGAAFSGLSTTDGAVNTIYGFAKTTTAIDISIIKNGVA